jgi:hypothetical protein
MKPRFTLRALLLLVALVAGFGYWRSRPAAIACQFVRALSAKDYDAAGALFQRSEDRCFGPTMRNVEWRMISAERTEQSFGDWIGGTARLLVSVDFDDPAFHGGPYIVEVTGCGVQHVDMAFSFNLSMTR